MKQRQHHREQRGFLAAMHGLRRSEYGGGLAGHRAAHPQRARAIEKCFSGAAMLPKRVGLPRRRPSHSRRSSCVAYGGPSSGTGGCGCSTTVVTCGTVRKRRARRSRTRCLGKFVWRVRRCCLCANKTKPGFRPARETPEISATRGRHRELLMWDATQRSTRVRARALYSARALTV